MYPSHYPSRPYDWRKCEATFCDATYFGNDYLCHNHRRQLEADIEASKRPSDQDEANRLATQKTLAIYKSYKPEPDPPDLDTWPCCPICGEYLDDDGECLMVKDGEATHDPLVKERRK